MIARQSGGAGRAEQAGVALIQAIVTALVLSLILAALSFQTQRWNETAQLADTQARLRLACTTATADLLDTLLTQPWSEGVVPSIPPESLATRWNFHGAWWPYDDQVELSLQDHNGLFKLSGAGGSRWASLLTALGWSNAEVREFGETVQRRIYPNGMGGVAADPLQTVDELRPLLPAGRTLADLPLEQISTLPVPSNNPLTAPTRLGMQDMMTSETADNLLALRAVRRHSAEDMARVVALETDEFVSLRIGPALRLGCRAMLGDSRFVIAENYNIQRPSRIPVRWLGREETSIEQRLEQLAAH